jgi:hypothetical protein
VSGPSCPKSSSDPPSFQSNSNSSAPERGSIPFRLSVPPSTRISANATGATPPTPGTSRIASTAARGMKLKSRAVTIRSACTRRSSAPVNDSLKPCARTVTSTTSATPMVRAEAVLAVRAGLRAVFSRASRAVPP